MKRRDFLKTLAAGTLAHAFYQKAIYASPKKKPNFVFILIDDLGWKDVGFMGSTFYETPNIDKLASDGMVFMDAYTNAPNCAPTRACLLSGQYSPRHGVYTVGTSERGKSQLRKLIPIKNRTVLPPEKITIAEALKPAGYIAASIGKWNLGDDPVFGPMAQGFDVNVGGNHAGKPKSYFSPYHNKNLRDGPAGEYLTDRLTDEALRFIRKNKDRPFFLYLPNYAVHTPIQAKRALVEKYRKKPRIGEQNNPVYAAMIESTDQGVGRIMDKLDELGLSDNTVVIFFSDNGGYGPVTTMAPLRGSKGMLYEGGIRVPLIIRWPGKIKPGSICEEPVVGIDFYPTILQMAGVPQPENYLDGKSLLPLFSDDELDRQAIFWHFPAYLEAYRGMKGPWRTTPAGAVRAGDWKLIEFFEDGKLELYNLKEDIGERNDLSEKMPEKTKELHTLLQMWRKSVNAPVPTKLNPEYDPSFMKKHSGSKKKVRKKVQKK